MSHNRQLQELRLATNPKHLQLLSLLQTPLFMLEQRLKIELEKNVLLEYEQEPINTNDYNQNTENSTEKIDISPTGDYQLDSTESYHNSDSNLYNLYDQRLLYLPSTQSARQLLHEQLIGLNLEEQERLVVEFLIESLDDNGLLSKPLMVLNHDLESIYGLSLSREQLISAIKIIQKMDPAGIGARNVAESLIIQLQRINPLPQIAITIIQDHYDDFLNKNIDSMINSIKGKLQANSEEISQAIKIITSLRPYPFFNPEESHINSNRNLIPDFILHREQNKLILQSQQIPNSSLRINNYYAKLLNSYSTQTTGAHKEAYVYLKDKYKQAQDLLDNLQNRSKLLLTVAKMIVDRQREFLISGDYSKIKPMTLKDLAEPLNLEISTLSRIIQNKYISTEFGIIKLKDCFIRARNNKSGEELNPNILSEQIQQIVNSESATSPYSDEQIQKLLSQKYHTNIARRTIAKYRQKLSIPPKNLRTLKNHS